MKRQISSYYQDETSQAKACDSRAGCAGAGEPRCFYISRRLLFAEGLQYCPPHLGDNLLGHGWTKIEARTPQEEQRYLYGLADFRKPDLLHQTMQMTLNGEVRTQNAPYLMQELLHNTECRTQAWAFLKEHWDKMLAQYPENAIPRMCEGVTVLVDHEREVDQFFATHKVKQGGKTIDQHLERLHIAASFRRREMTGAPSDFGGQIKRPRAALL